VAFLSGNDLPITIGVAGIVVSIVCSWVFYWLGGRITRRQNESLLKEINDVRKLLAGYVQSMSERLGLTSHVQEKAAERSSAGIQTADAPGDAEPNAAVDELVRASLGALVNARGEVDMSRLMRELSFAMGQQGLAAALRVLQRLRSGGVVEWDGSDESLPLVRTLHVQSPRAGQEMWPTISQAGSAGTEWVPAR
jgi:hypothetical protein